MFRIAVITYPEKLPDEVHALRIVGNIPRVCAIHLRKPGYSQSQIRLLLESLSPEILGKVRLHDHFELCEEYGVQGVHLNRRNPTPPRHISSISASCHDLQQVREYKKTCDYVFLSPIFDSISKAGYTGGFLPETLAEAGKNGIIDYKVLALGGVRTKYFPLLRQWGFGGAAMLGEIWQDYRENPDLNRFTTHLKNLFNRVDDRPWI